MSDADEDLVQRFLTTGRVDAFDVLVRRHQRYVFRIAVAVLGHGREAHAEDVTQEVFLQVYRKLGDFAGRSRFSTWLYRIAYRRAIDHLRALAARPATTLSDTGREHGHGDLLRDQALLACIERLPEAQRAAVRLHYWLGHSVAEAAGPLGVQPGTVKSWLFRARDLLNRCLASKGVHA